jgi:hypothetical protein
MIKPGFFLIGASLFIVPAIPAEPGILAHVEEEADCAGCEKRLDGGEPFSDEAEFFGCTYSFREVYTQYSQKCRTTSKIACPSRTCTFTWHFQGKDSGGVACNGDNFTIEEIVPPATTVLIPTTNSFEDLIDPVSETDAECGYSTSRSGTFKSNGMSAGRSYDFTIGCLSCAE